MSTTQPRGPPVASWENILRQAITTPGIIHEAYSRFHRFSLRNQLLAMNQCIQRGLAPGPMATYVEWERFGRHVLRGEKALVLCMPINVRERKSEDEHAEETKEDDSPTADVPRVFFAYRARWFVLSQTDGDECKPLAVPAWDDERALRALAVRQVPFDELDGNIQGYATKGREVAINPLAALPHKTLFHELAHILLGHVQDKTMAASLHEVEAEGVALLCREALGLDGAMYARGYLQHWLKHDELTDAMAQRIIATAQRILAAGTRESTAEASERVAPAVRSSWKS